MCFLLLFLLKNSEQIIREIGVGEVDILCVLESGWGGGEVEDKMSNYLKINSSKKYFFILILMVVCDEDELIPTWWRSVRGEMRLNIMY